MLCSQRPARNRLWPQCHQCSRCHLCPCLTCLWRAADWAWLTSSSCPCHLWGIRPPRRPPPRPAKQILLVSEVSGCLLKFDIYLLFYFLLLCLVFSWFGEFFISIHNWCKWGIGLLYKTEKSCSQCLTFLFHETFDRPDPFKLYQKYVLIKTQ